MNNLFNEKVKKPSPSKNIPTRILDDFGYIIITVIFLLLIFTVSPYGEFPLNDDWAYAETVRNFIQGKMLISDWAAPTLLLQVFWAAGWIKIFGFSFTVLRISNLVLSLLALYLFYYFLRYLALSRRRSLCGVLLLMFNPLYLNLSYSFMTEIPYLLFALIAVFYFYRALQTDRPVSLGLTIQTKPIPEPVNYRYFLLGSLFATLTYLIRQIGLMIPFATVLILFWQKKLTKKIFIAVCIIPICGWIFYTLWFTFIHHGNWASRNYLVTATLTSIQNIPQLVSQIFLRVCGTLIYLGFALLPVLCGLGWQLFKNKSKRSNSNFPKIPIKTFFFCSLVLFILIRRVLPYFENVISKYGIGTITLHDFSFKPTGFFGSSLVWFFLTLGGFGAINYLIKLIVNEWENKTVRRLIVLWVIQFIPFLFTAKFFDRYILTLLPISIILLLFLTKELRVNPGWFLITISGFACISVCGLQDYFAWNSAKWQAGEYTVRQGIPAQEIANGFDWDAWHSYSKNMQLLKLQKPITQIGEWEWQQLNRYRAKVSFAPDLTAQGLKLFYKSEYHTFLSFKKEYVYVWVPPT